MASIARAPGDASRYAAAEYGDKHQCLEYGCKKKWWRIVLLKMGAA
jgi:hypothetical protein